MLRLLSSVRASALTLMTLGCTAALSLPAASQDAASRQFSAKAGEKVLAAQNLMTAENPSGALAILASALTVPELTPYERAIILQMQGANYYALKQFGPAVAAFEGAVKAGGLNAAETADMEVKIAQLLIANDQQALGAQRLEDYFNSGGQQKPEYVELLAQAWLQAQNYKRALPWAEKWVAAANPKERRHYDTLNFLYNALKRPERQAEVVKEMIMQWPEERELWEAWASLFADAGQDEDAFAVKKLLYLGGALTTEPEILQIVQYYSYYEMPYQAAQILERELNAGRVTREPEKLVQLASLFRQAREYGRAIPVLEAATKMDASGDLHAGLGEALYNEGECERAETAFKQAINRGYDAGKAWTLIATCRYEDVQKQEKLSCKMSEEAKAVAPRTVARQSTIAAFENVPPASTQSRDAKKWISFIKAERQTFEQRCEFEEKVRRDECFKDIERAYRNQFTDGKFTLGNPDCEAYVAAFNVEYRGTIEGRYLEVLENSAG
ncbi:hypothetical protein N9W89_06940 [Hellea sp.]|nr:hypothetical protein [Hellea sp.]